MLGFWPSDWFVRAEITAIVGGADLSRHRRPARPLQKLQSGWGDVRTDALQIPIGRGILPWGCFSLFSILACLMSAESFRLLRQSSGCNGLYALLMCGDIVAVGTMPINASTVKMRCACEWGG